MGRILFVEVDREVRSLLQDTLEQHGYQVQAQESIPALKLHPGPGPTTSFVLCLAGEASRPLEEPTERQPANGNPSFLIACLRAFSTWST